MVTNAEVAVRRVVGGEWSGRLSRAGVVNGKSRNRWTVVGHSARKAFDGKGVEGVMWLTFVTLPKGKIGRIGLKKRRGLKH